MTTDKADNAAQIRFSLPERIRHTSQTTLTASTFPPTIGSNLNMRLAATTEMLPKDPENENTKTLRSNRGLSLWTDAFSERVDVEDIGGDQNAPQNAFQAFQTAKDFEELFGNQQKLVFAGHERITTGLDQPIDLTGFCVALASFAEGEFGSTTFAVWDITGPPTPSTVTFPQQDPISGGGAITAIDLIKWLPSSVPETGGTMSFLSLSLMPLIATRMIGRSTRRRRAV